MKTIILSLSVILLTSVAATIDYSTLADQSVSVQVNGAEELIVIAGEKAMFTAGDGVLGYNSKFNVKGETTALEFKKGTDLVFYVRTWSKVKEFSLSVVKMEIVKGNRIAQSKTGVSADRDQLIKSIPFKAVELDKEKQIYKITLNDAPSVGTWCVNFHSVQNGKFLMVEGYGKEGFCFNIVE